MEKRKWNIVSDEPIETSLLGFGCMRFETKNGLIDKEKALDLIDKAYKNGVNYFDTAMPYTNGQNETFVGMALKRYPRNSFFLATKFSIHRFKDKNEAFEAIDKQLQALQTDYIDFYLVHALSKETFKIFKEWNAYDKLLEWKKEGKIKHIGFSFHDDYETFIEILDSYKWEFVQIQLNYMDIDIQQGIKGYYELEKRNIPCLIMEPVKGGKLAVLNNDIANEFKKISDATLASFALRFVGSLKGVKVVLSGMNDMSQLDDNLNTFSNFIPLNDEEMNVINNVREKIKSVSKVGCTNCKYCLPCPKNINIPKVLTIYNNYAMYNDKNDAIWNYKQLVDTNEGIDSCISCDACYKSCPQKIRSSEIFKEIKKEMEFLFNDINKD